MRHDALELAVGLAQADRLLAQHAHGDLGVGLDHVPEHLAADDDEVPLFDDLGRGRARQALQDGHLAEEIALLQHGQRGVGVLHLLLDGDAAGLDDVHVVAFVAFVEEDLAAVEVGQELREGVLFRGHGASGAGVYQNRLPGAQGAQRALASCAESACHCPSRP